MDLSKSQGQKSVSFSLDENAARTLGTSAGSDEPPLLNPPSATAAALGTTPPTGTPKQQQQDGASATVDDDDDEEDGEAPRSSLRRNNKNGSPGGATGSSQSSSSLAEVTSLKTSQLLQEAQRAGATPISSLKKPHDNNKSKDDNTSGLSHMSAPSPNIHLRNTPVQGMLPKGGAGGDQQQNEKGKGGKDGRSRVTSQNVKDKLYGFQRKILSLLVDFIMWALVNIFFREVSVVGLENIPKEGPIVFYGNHQNQFIDAMMIRAHCGRPVRYIIAEKSMHRPVIGHFAAIMDSVPVIRPQDVGSTQGAGKIIRTEGCCVIGEGTDFSKILTVGDVLSWGVPTKKERCSGQVTMIKDDTHAILTMAVEDVDAVTTPTSFKYSRRIDHGDMYKEVYGTLDRGGVIGIFPEGGSHDRTSLQPMKAGVALFTLGAAERGTPVKMIPCGLTYFYGHKFRSRAHLEFGEPLEPPKALVEEFKTNKRAATGELLKVLDLALRGVTINVPDWQTLKFLHSFRQLYQPQQCLLQTRDYLRLTRRLSLMIASRGEESDFSDFRTKVENYSDYCGALLVRDSQAATLENIEEASFTLLTRRIFMLGNMGIILIPFAIISIPIGLFTHFAAETHARTALAASTVKVVGADVKASYKIVIGFVMVPLVMSLVACTVGYFTTMRTGLTVFFCTPMAMYVSLMILQEFLMELRASLPLVMSLFSKHKQFKKLFERRKKLVSMAQDIVGRYDPELVKEIELYEAASGSGATGANDLRVPSLFSLRHGSRRRDAHKKHK